MKIRSDYVSNSSSASFIVEGKDSAIKFYEDFKDIIDSGSMPKNPSAFVIIKSTDDEYFDDSKDFMDFVDDVNSGEASWDDVLKICFDSPDEDSDGISYLGFLYMYFTRLGFKVNDDDSQRDFLGSNANDEFLDRIVKKIGESNEGKN